MNHRIMSEWKTAKLTLLIAVLFLVWLVCLVLFTDWISWEDSPANVALDTVVLAFTAFWFAGMVAAALVVVIAMSESFSDWMQR